MQGMYIKYKRIYMFVIILVLLRRPYIIPNFIKNYQNEFKIDRTILTCLQ